MPCGFVVTLKSAVPSLLSAVTGLQFCPLFRGLQGSPAGACCILAVLGRGKVQLSSILLAVCRRRPSAAPAVRGAQLSKSSSEGIFIVFANLPELCLWLSVSPRWSWTEIPEVIKAKNILCIWHITKSLAKELKQNIHFPTVFMHRYILKKGYSRK